MSVTIPTVEAVALANAIAKMTSRYGDSVQEYAYALTAHADERARHLRAMRRRFAAVQRLARTLADMTGGAA